MLVHIEPCDKSLGYLSFNQLLCIIKVISICWWVRLVTSVNIGMKFIFLVFIDV